MTVSCNFPLPPYTSNALSSSDEHCFPGNLRFCLASHHLEKQRAEKSAKSLSNWKYLPVTRELPLIILYKLFFNPNKEKPPPLHKCSTHSTVVFFFICWLSNSLWLWEFYLSCFFFFFSNYSLSGENIDLPSEVSILVQI